MSEPRLHFIWRLMVGRCHNDNWDNPFCKKYYKDKGISVCDEWRFDFNNFKNWAETNGYKDNLSIERINPDGDYKPDNCRWIPLNIKKV